MTAPALDTTETPRPVRLLTAIPGLPDHGCMSCGSRANVWELFISVSGWAFSAHLCPACMSSSRADLT